MAHMMVLGGEAFGRGAGPQDGTLMNGIRALTKETPESSLVPSSCEVTQ